MSTRLRTTLAVLGDPHFGTEDPPVVEALLRDLRDPAPDVVILAGDLTQRARSAEFAAARAFIDRLPGRTLAIPGNHDLPLFDVARRLFAPYARFRRYISRELEPTLALGAVTVLGVDATRRTRHKHGVLDREHVREVAERLRAVRTPFRVVVVHQPLAAAVAEDEHNVARGSEDAIAAWTAVGADLIVGGHVHRGYSLRVGEQRGAILAQTGTATSVRRRGTPNSYYRIELSIDADDARSMRLARRDYDARSGGFTTSAPERARARQNGWDFDAATT